MTFNLKTAYKSYLWAYMIGDHLGLDPRITCRTSKLCPLRSKLLTPTPRCPPRKTFAVKGLQL